MADAAISMWQRRLVETAALVMTAVGHFSCHIGFWHVCGGSAGTDGRNVPSPFPERRRLYLLYRPQASAGALVAIACTMGMKILYSILQL